jgi:F420-0:gamma-glutamyl ligase
MHGLIRTFKEPPGAPPEVTEGTLLWFEPGGIKAHVIKRNLSEDEINTIGIWCYELDRQNAALDYVPRAIVETDKLRHALIAGGYHNDTQINLDLSGLGVMLETLRNSTPKLVEWFHRLAETLVKCGVTLVESETKSTRDGVTPVALIVAKHQLSKSTA